MSKPIQQKMHTQHRQWQRDHESWLADIAGWKKGLKTALGNLAEVADMLRDSLEAIDAHAEAIWENEQRRSAHELVLSAELRAGAGGKTDKRWAGIHRRRAAQHERLAAAHARIGKCHRAVVAEVARLVKRARSAL